jgi:hypothetical protein
MLVPMSLALGAVYLVRYFERRRRLRSPLSNNLLRSPGESLIAQIDDMTEDILTYFLLMILAPYILFHFIFRNPISAVSP